MQQYLYRIHFVIKLNAKTLIAQLNCLMSDLSDALVTQ